MDLNKFYECFYGVVNLSNRRLSSIELSILGKGLSFCPTPNKFDHGPLKEDIDKFFRKCSLKLFFEDDHSDEIVTEDLPKFEHKDLKPPSTFSPPMPNNLNYIYNLIIEEVLNYKPVVPRKNVTSEQLTAIKNLSQDKTLIFKKADKGSNIVVLNRHDYCAEAYSQLRDKNFYKELCTDTSNLYRQHAIHLVEEMHEKNQISDKTYKYLISGGDRTAVFYTLPKIHKNRDRPPGRPIVSGVNSATEKISQMIDIILRPFAQKGSSFVKDTPDVISKLQTVEINDDEWLFTMDVKGLYTNIPHDEGIEEVTKIIAARTDMPENYYIIEMLKLVLKGNVFRFDNDFFIQIHGTAMGTRVAPTYSIIFMNAFEEKFIYPYPRRPKIWLRFIDDVLGIFKGTEQELLEFFNYCNNLHDTIKFSYEYSKNQAIFLDLIIYKKLGTNKLFTTVYTKPTDSKSYLDYSSCHPTHNKCSIPYSQFLRIRRNCTEWCEFAKHSVELSSHLSMRGYPSDLIRDSLIKVCKLTQQDTLNTDQQITDQSKLVLTMDFNPSNPNIYQIIQNLWDKNDRSASTRSLCSMNIVIGYRRPKNIKDLICRSDIRDDKVFHNRIPHCNRWPKCPHCNRLNKSGSIKSTSTGRNYKSLKKISCNSRNLIYCIECNITDCHLQYVGQTKNALRLRMNQHLSNIRCKSDTPVARHFNRHGLGNFSVYILQLIRSDKEEGVMLRNKWENHWIARLHTITPQGLNILD